MEGAGGNDNKYRRAIKHMKKKIQACFLCPVKGTKTLDSAHYLSIWGGEIGVGERKKKFSLQFTQEIIFYLMSSTNLKGTKGNKKSSLTNLAEMCPRGFRQYTS